MSTKVEKALELHDKGYNCAQAVACSFCEEFGVDQETMFKISWHGHDGHVRSCNRNDDGYRNGQQHWKS